MAQFIASIIGLFSNYSNSKKALYYQNMTEYEREIEKNQNSVKISKALEVIIPFVLIIIIGFFYYKIYKKWL